MKIGPEKTEKHTLSRKFGRNLNAPHLRTKHLQVAGSLPAHIPCPSTSHSSLKSEPFFRSSASTSSLYRIFTWEREQQVDFLRHREMRHSFPDS